MTTIVYADGVLAADRRAMSGEWLMGTVCKLHDLGDGAWAAVWGNLTSASQLLDWLRETPQVGWLARGSDRPKLESGVGILVVRPDHPLLLMELSGHAHIRDHRLAWGSGAPPAQAALMMGASAVRAVEVASRLDNHTGDGIDWVDVSARGTLQHVD